MNILLLQIRSHLLPFFVSPSLPTGEHATVTPVCHWHNVIFLNAHGQLKSNQAGRVTHNGKMRNELGGKPDRKKPLEYLGIDVRIITEIDDREIQSDREVAQPNLKKFKMK